MITLARISLVEVSILAQSDKSREREGSALASRKPFSDSLLQFVDAVLVRQLFGPHVST